ncbi:MAG: hypothetical protein NZO16_05645, partial [Deltaproteobacteria bacterium]|nr:hypothetical protein [Deltaproteobacteria bacterium]
MLVCTVVLYFGIRFVDIPLVTFSTILLVLVAFVSLIALVVWWGAKRLEVTNIQSDIFGFAGENLRVCYSFDFAFPIPFFYFRLKPEITEL